ncbi:NADPH-dependent F420 reductase [Thermomonospora umbrina]|uniref:Pyrroline-5-carboxylate reductase catalytic N-terminal domain-containing protein n=1 Tax=Thermomonospora umbrina TaxID=111806 RepID=A0A3D9SK97_9ACTN|nr:NAD(P)-binding domain-containing protein [Thermomonospora umbrina]REE96298.1 hypothetical protein DFJ69_1728 [Thermomonospora umbrina]
MRIGVIGAGQMAEALGTGWARAGHEVMIGARSPEKAADLAERIGRGARGGDLREAAEYGDVTLLALPAGAIDELLRKVGDTLSGRPLIDCANAFAPDAFTGAPDSFRLDEEALAERVAGLAPDAHVVKAFNLCAAEVWESQTKAYEGRTLAVPLCGDDRRALTTVAGLVTDLGLHPVPAGGLDRARYLEAMGVFVIGLWFAGHDARAIFPPLEAAFAVPDDGPS